MSGIHSSCTLPMFKAAITTAFAERGVAAQPERVVMSQPVWTKTMPSKFERLLVDQRTFVYCSTIAVGLHKSIITLFY